MSQAFSDHFDALIKQVTKGAFLTTKGRFNPMTIGWCQLGIIWNRQVCTVLVRKSRFSYGLMMDSPSFCVSIPETGTMADALAFCGSRSGRDVDKAKEANLAPLTLIAGESPGVEGCTNHLVCRKLFWADSDLSRMDPSIIDRYYNTNQALPDGDPHVIFFGEILKV